MHAEELYQELLTFTPVGTGFFLLAIRARNTFHLCCMKSISLGSVFTAAKGGELCKVCSLVQNSMSHVYLYIHEAITIFIIFPGSVSVNIKME